MKRFVTYMIIAIAAMLSLTSCGDERYGEYYYSPLVGSWELAYINNMPATQYEVCMFTFYDNGTGVFGQYSPQLVWNTYRITWDCYFPNNFDDYVNIYTWDGQTWNYRFRVERNGYYPQLILFDTLTGNTLVFNSSY